MVNDVKTISVTSPAFGADGWIPDRYSGYGEDLSPELHIDGIENAACLAITLDDMGHPIFPGFNHWVVWNLPVLRVIPEGLPKGASYEKPFHVEQGIAYGRHRYRGPKPPFNWNHEYRFTVYALDMPLAISPDSNKAVLLKAMEGHILQTGILTGKYQRRHV